MLRERWIAGTMTEKMFAAAVEDLADLTQVSDAALYAGVYMSGLSHS